jgi:PAS domain S-box-containing protein
LNTKFEYTCLMESLNKQDKLEKTADSAYKLDPFFELSPDLLCIAGYDGFFKRINPAVSNVLGYSNKELYSRPINDFIHHEDQEITSRVRSELTKRTPLYNFENRYISKSGEVIWLSWTSFPFEDDQVIFAIAKVITHKKALEEERNLLLANLTRLNGELKQLSYSTSHDLRSPVNNMLSVFELLDTSRISDEETLEFIDMLKLAGKNLSETVNQYIDTLVKKELLDTHSEVLDLNEVFQRALKSIQSLVHISRATVEVDFSEQQKIEFNKGPLESIFLNLLTNAIKYARPDTPPKITIRSSVSNGRSQLIFSDNGLGFDMDSVKDRIFGLHQKFHNHPDSKGIGLYLIHNHITNAGGTIDVESKVNEGTTFTITFKGSFAAPYDPCIGD